MIGDHLASRGQYGVFATLDDVMTLGVAFTMSNSTTVSPNNIVAPLGTKITAAAGGEISITFPFRIAPVPKALRTGFAWITQASNQVGLVADQPADNVLRLTPASAIGSSTRINVLGIGPDQPSTIESPGNTQVSKMMVGNRGRFSVASLLRDASFMPISGTFQGGLLTIDTTSRRISARKVAAGFYDLDIGIHKTDTVVSMFALSTGAPVTQSLVTDGRNVRIQTSSPAADPANGTRIMGFIQASWTKER